MVIPESALGEWVRAVGPEHLVADETVLGEWQTATFRTSQRIPAILRPANADQVASCMQIAARHLIPVYPVSQGKNWGLGSRVPVTDSVILDLSRLNAITAWDERYGCLTLEPGVTFAQVHAYLTAQNARWFLPVIGGPPGASVIGNCIERGDGIGPSSERASAMCNLQVVLPSGESLQTGFAHFGKTPLAPLSAMPAGPFLDGLFTQSNLGVVTRATLWLARIPEYFQVVSAKLPAASLGRFIDSLQLLVSRLGTAASTFSVWNGHKLNARTLNPGVSGDAWFASGALYAASQMMGAAQCELTVDTLAEAAEHLEILEEGNTPDLRQTAGIFLGVPSDQNVRSLYSHRKDSVPDGELDPDRDRCGVVWLCPEIPFDGTFVERTIQLCENTCAQHGFDPVIGMSGTSPRTLRLFISLLYNRTPEDDTRAARCHDQLLSELAAIGAFPFRLGIQSMKFMRGADNPFQTVLDSLKGCLDPARILAPGRYDGQ